jgi:hypothetical protein
MHWTFPHPNVHMNQNSRLIYSFSIYLYCCVLFIYRKCTLWINNCRQWRSALTPTSFVLCDYALHNGQICSALAIIALLIWISPHDSRFLGLRSSQIRTSRLFSNPYVVQLHAARIPEPSVFSGAPSSFPESPHALHRRLTPLRRQRFRPWPRFALSPSDLRP